MKNFMGYVDLQRSGWGLTREEMSVMLGDLLSDHRKAQKVDGHFGRVQFAPFTRAKIFIFIAACKSQHPRPQDLEKVGEY